MLRCVLLSFGALCFSVAAEHAAPDEDGLVLLQVRVGKVQRHFFDDHETALSVAQPNSSKLTIDVTDVQANMSGVSNSLSAANSSELIIHVADVQANVSGGAANVSEDVPDGESPNASSTSLPWNVSADDATAYWQKALVDSEFQDPPLDANTSKVNVMEVAAPLKANVSGGNATTPANKSADLLEVGILEVPPAKGSAVVKGSTAELSEAGYHLVATLKNATEMETFVLRVAESMDVTVARTGWRALRGFVPFYSGDKAVRSVRAMKEEMRRIAAIPHAWLSKRGGSAPLNEVGFDAVASLKSRTDMERFVRRMASDYLDMTVMSEEGLKEFVPHYSGDKGKKEFDVLLDELRSVAKSKSSWLIDRHEDLMHAGEECLSHCKEGGYCSWCGVGNACCKNGDDAAEECRAAVTDFHTSDYECLQIATGASAPLDQRGYAAVLELKNNTMMMRFVRRVSEHLDMTVQSEMSLAGLIPWYSGVQGKKSFNALKAELIRVSKLPNGWLAPRGKTAPLNGQGYNFVAALGSNLEMAAFARRVARNLHLEVKDEKGLRGLVPYYSGDRTRHDFPTLASELKHLSEKPGGWIVPGPVP